MSLTPTDLKLLIVDDHPIVRDGLKAVLSLQPDFYVKGDVASAAEAIDAISRLQPDIAIVDISLPDKNGIDLVKDIRKISPKTKIIIYSMHDAGVYADRARKAGASGYVMKEEGAAKVVEGIREILEGRWFQCPEHRVDEPKPKSVDTEDLPIESLSDRQLEIFELVGAGMSSLEIGEKLSISHKTVNAHKMNIEARLRIDSARELLIAATRWIDRNS
jgi:DNA-binding NarL/FixJ family response regulator